MALEERPLVGILMGSRSDWETMANAAKVLDTLGIPYEVNVMSAHRTPTLVDEYVSGPRRGGSRSSSRAPAGPPTWPE